METEKLKGSQVIDFPSKTENITLVERLVDEVCEEYKINEDYYGNILIALTEAVNNAIHHGNNKDSEKMISVSFQPAVQQGRLSFKVADEGPGFDYENLPDPTEPENLEKISGRGVFLMSKLADEIEFHQNGSIVELHFQAIGAK